MKKTTDLTFGDSYYFETKDGLCLTGVVFKNTPRLITVAHTFATGQPPVDVTRLSHNTIKCFKKISLRKITQAKQLHYSTSTRKSSKM